MGTGGITGTRRTSSSSSRWAIAHTAQKRALTEAAFRNLSTGNVSQRTPLKCVAVRLAARLWTKRRSMQHANNSVNGSTVVSVTNERPQLTMAGKSNARLRRKPPKVNAHVKSKQRSRYINKQR